MRRLGRIFGMVSAMLLLLASVPGCNQYFPSDSVNCPTISSASTVSPGSEKVTITQGVWGDIRYWTGDFMPKGSSASNPCPQAFGLIKNVKRDIVIFPLINPTTNPTSVQTDSVGSPFYVQINLTPIASVTSDSSGFYEVSLAAGNYSIFTKESYLSKVYYYANGYDGAGNIQPIKIVSGQKTNFPVNITYASIH